MINSTSLSAFQCSESPAWYLELVNESITCENDHIVFLALNVATVHHEKVTLLQFAGFFEMTFTFSLVDQHSV